MSNRLLAGAGALAVIGMGLVVAPFLTGNAMEQRFRQLARDHARTGVMELYLLSYERGYYSSEAITRLQVPGEDGAALHLDLQHHIIHGLGMGGLNYGEVITTPRLDGEAGESLRRTFGDKTPLRLATTVGFGGSVEGQLYSPPVEGSADGPGPVQWQGLAGSFEMDAREQMRLALKLPGVTAGRAGLRASIRDVVVNADMYRSESSGIWLGESSASLGAVELSEGSQNVKLSGVAFGGKSTEENGAVRMSISYALGGMTGQDTDVRDFMLRISLSNIDAGALKAYSDAMEQASAASEQEQMLQVMQALQQALPNLLARRPALIVDEGRMRYNGTPVSFSGRIAYVGDPDHGFNPMTDIEGEAALQAPRALLEQAFVQRARGKARESMSAETLLSEAAVIEADAREQAAQTLGQYLAQGLLVEVSEGIYRLSLRYGRNGLTVNGQPVGGPR